MTVLSCLDGGHAPDDLQANLRSWRTLPADARANFWELLLPNLAPDVDERLTERVHILMAKYELTAEELGPSVSACRLMLRNAARHNLPPERFLDDARAVAGDDSELVDGLDDWYRRALPLLRKEIVMSTVAEHGNLASSLRWRVDMVTRSHRGKGVNTPVAVFTFRYLQGTSEKSFTLQLLPEMLDEVQRACTEILS